MAYYDIYDSNDNVIAEGVWIDDVHSGGIPRPIVINWYKIFIIIALVVGAVSTFITPINLFINRDVFVDNGWIYMALFNLLLGVPILIVALTMIKIMKEKTHENDPIYEAASIWVNNKFQTENTNADVEEMTDKEYVSNTKNSNKKEALIASLYVVIKYKSILKKLSYISYLIYPLAIVSMIIELTVSKENVFFIILFNFNFIVMILGLLCLYKNYILYQKSGIEKVIIRLVKTSLISFFVGVVLVAIVCSILKCSSYYLLVICLAIMDLSLFIDNKIISKKGIKKRGNKRIIKIGTIILISICTSIFMLIVACVGSLIPGPIYDAVLAYDNGVSTDLSLPIIFWCSCLIIDIILILSISFLTAKKTTKKEQ